MRTLKMLVCPVLLSLCAPAQPQQPIAKFGTTVVLPLGLKGLVYHIRRNAERLPDFRKMKPVGTIYAATLDVPPQDFREGFPGVSKRYEWFAIDYSGRFWVEKPGLYRFALTSDDGARLYIDDQLIIDNDGTHAVEERTGSIELSGGIHRIRVPYFQGPRFHVALILEVAGPDEELRLFSTDEFKPPSNLETWTDPDVDPRAILQRRK